MLITKLLALLYQGWYAAPAAVAAAVVVQLLSMQPLL
jgi:hypothetical protein